MKFKEIYQSGEGKEGNFQLKFQNNCHGSYFCLSNKSILVVVVKHSWKQI